MGLGGRHDIKHNDIRPYDIKQNGVNWNSQHNVAVSHFLLLCRLS
jgi:hypothetical protein